MISVNEQSGKVNLAVKTGILQYAGKLGHSIVENGLAKAIPLAGKLAAKGGWLGKLGVSAFITSASMNFVAPSPSRTSSFARSTQIGRASCRERV